MIEAISLLGVALLTLYKAYKSRNEKGAWYILVAILAGVKAIEMIFGK